MPPKRSQKTKPTASQPGTTATFKTLCEHLKQAWTTEGEIKAPEVVNTLKGILRTQRQKSTSLEPKFLIDIVSSIQKDGDDLGSRIDENIFIIIGETIFQTDYCIENERALYLLSASLYRDRGGTVSGKTIQKRKDMIGKSILQPALAYFIDANNHPGLRRWAGTLSMQLLQGSEENCNRLATGSATRQAIGELVISETNEVIRIICGKLIRTVMQSSNMALQSLWRADSDEILYGGFPIGPEEDEEWSQLFSDYIDNLFNHDKITRPDVDIFPAEGCELLPGYRFGSENNCVSIMVDENRDWLTIMPSTTESMDHIIDIPIPSLDRLVAVFQDNSQEERIELLVHVKNDNDTFCSLDGEGVKLDVINLYLTLEVSNALVKCLREKHPSLELFEEYRNPNGGVDENALEARPSQQTDVIVLDGGELETSEESSVDADNLGPIYSQQASVIVLEEGRLKAIKEAAGDVVGARFKPKEGQQTEYVVMLDHGESKTFKPVARKGSRNGSTKSVPEQEIELRSAPESQPSDDEGNNSMAEAPENQTPNDDLYGASPRKRYHPAVKSVVDAQYEVDPNSRQKSPEGKTDLKSIARKRKGVKPIAKQPIRAVQYRPKEKKAQKLVGAAEQNKRSAKATASKIQPGAKPSDIAKAASTAKAPEILHSEPLSSPETNDASTPKTDGAEKDDGDFVPTLQTTGQHLANVSQTRSKKLDVTAIHAARAKGRGTQSLGQGAKAPTSDTADVYEIPVEEESYKPAVRKERPKAPSKAAPKSQKQNKKTAPKDDSKKRQSAPSALESVEPTKSRPTAKERGLEVPVKENMQPPLPKARANVKKRQSPPENGGMPPPEPRVTRSSKNAESQSQESNATIVHAEHAIEPARGGEDEFSMEIDYDSFGSIPVLEDVARETPIKKSTRPREVAERITETRAKQSVNNSGLEMASKLESILDSIGTADDAQANPPTPPARSSNEKRAAEQRSKRAIAEFAAPYNDQSATIMRTSAATNAGPSTFKVSDKPMQPSKTQGKREVVQGRSTKGLANATPDRAESSTPVERGSLNEARKRKAPRDKDTLSKRPRPAEVDARAQDVGPSPRRSPRIAAKLDQKNQDPSSLRQFETPEVDQEESQEQPSPAMLTQKALQNHAKSSNETLFPAVGPAVRPSQEHRKKSPLSTRKSPRGKAKWHESTEGPDTMYSKTPLVDDHKSRKPPVISFSKYGALNQGISSTPREPASHNVPADTPAKKLSDGKRKRDRDDVADVQSPLKKRFNDSPVEQDFVDEFGDDPVFGSSPPQPSDKQTKAIETLKLVRQSSQGSRVDVNGSPRASPATQQIDHMKKAKLRLKKQMLAVEEQMEPEEKTPQVRERRISDAFGPRLRLESQSKARPESPDKTEPRYVAHKKTKNGHYEKVNSKEVILPAEELADPFREEGRLFNDFSQRLRAGPTVAQKSHEIRGQNRRVREYQENPEKTLVNMEADLPSLSSGSTADSRSSEASRSPLGEMAPEEQWNMAVRPHYATLTQAVHRIADEVIIRLADEEDKMGLLVEEYKENGTKVLDNLAQKRAGEKSKMLHSLKEQKEAMAKTYTAARNSISKLVEKLKQKPLARVDKEWRIKQDLIREKMNQGGGDDE